MPRRDGFLRALGHIAGSTHTKMMRISEEFRLAANGLGQHPQDHGWRDLYRLFGHGLSNSAPNLATVLREQHEARPTLSATHILTLLGIALKHAEPEGFHAIASEGPVDGRLVVLESLVEQHRDRICHVVQARQNSFTSARRFLVPQILLSAYFASEDGREARFADLGTGLGVLPRQLNSAQQFDTFAHDLVWPCGVPAFREIPLAARHGIDRGPMPDLDWVRACYGESEYYANLFGELLWTLETAEVKSADVNYAAIDLLDSGELVRFIRHFRINAVNLSYVLYEFEHHTRSNIIEAILRELQPPGIMLVSEPHRELHSQGTVVELFRRGASRPMTLCYVSDGHYKGYVIPLDDYDAFIRDHPIEYGLVGA